MTFKTRELTVDLVNEISTNEIRFSQGDENSAKLVLNITNQGQELDLTKATAVRITFEKSDGKTVFQQDCQVINAMKGKYQIVLNTQTLAVVGNVYGQVQIIEGGQKIDSQLFVFTVKRSLSSNDVVESTNEFTIIQRALEVGDQFKDVDFAPIIKAGETAEKALVEVNKNKDQIGILSENVSGVSSQLADKTDKTYVDTKVSAVASGSPKGTYATLADLQTAKPTGDSYIYLVAADGKWYYWNGLGAWVAGGVYQSTGIADNAVDYKNLNFAQVGKNRFDKNAVTKGYYISKADGTLAASASYDLTDFMPVTKGVTYASSPRVRHALLYDAGKTPIQSTYMTAITSNYSFTPTQDGYVRFSLFATETETFQLEVGSTPTEYRPFEYTLSKVTFNPKQKQDIEAIVVSKADPKDLKVTKSGESFIVESVLSNGSTIQVHTLRNGSANGSFGFVKTLIDGVQVHDTRDDVTPIRTFSTVGANHGYITVVKITMANHGKATADLGSKWTDGTTTYTLLDINGNELTLGCPYTVVDGVVSSTYVAPKSALTHVSGATNTGNIDITTIVASPQLFPSINNKSVKYVLDGIEVTADGTYSGNELQIRESYNIMDYKAIIDYAQSNIGKTYKNDSVAGVLKMSINYTFTKGCKCLISHGLKALKKVTLNTTGFLQSVALTATNHTLKRYMPNVLPKEGYDFKNLVDMASYASTLAFYKADFITANKPPNRYVDWLYDGSGNKKYGFTMGYVFDKTNSKTSDILSQVGASYYWDLRNTKKSYPTAISVLTMNEGEYKTILGYRHYLVPSEATNINIVEDKRDTYVYIDYHQDVIGKSISLNKHIGKQVTVLDSSNFTLLNDIVDAEGVTFNISNNYGYAVLKVS